MIYCCLNSYQSGNWWNKPGRADLLSTGTSEADSEKTARVIAHPMATSDVIGQKSAEAIVAQCLG